MAVFGDDFRLAGREWLYPKQSMQWVFRALLFFVGLFVIYNVLQVFFGLAIFRVVLGGSLSDLAHSNQDGMAKFIKAGLLAILPSAIPTVLLALAVAKFGLPQRAGRLPIQLPKLGWLGWFIVVGGFLVVSFAAFQGVFAALGIDPATYAPSSGGLSDKNSLAGLVEKAMADLSKDPKLYTFVTLSAAVAAPAVEELLFRGALFAALVQSPVGRFGAVLITAALFGLAHAFTDGWPIVIVLFLMGISLGVLLLRFGSIWVTIACHSAWNAVQSLALYAIGTHS